ncbi:speckle-type POZ protein B [Copidosoma floridanum]|uniref:speckle-type POZ protein B n=1 Tax=Copidosoma floridanum TaxID=29053 RepID=UPI0006C96414|nr:speckle-type POZ protein B [Copidosoma floridanum]
MESDSDISDLLIHVPEVYVSWKIKNFSTYKKILNSEFSLHNESGTCLKETEKSSMCHYSDYYQSWGFLKLCKRDEILNLLENDMLDVHCWIKWKTDISIGNKLGALDEIDRLSNLSCGYKKLMDEGSFSDVILEANDGTKIPAHKSILASRSSVFAEMFSHDMKENKESKVEIKDLDEKVLKTMLQYIYSGSFNENDCQINELFEAADKYDLQALKECTIKGVLLSLTILYKNYYMVACHWLGLAGNTNTHRAMK